MEYDVTATSLFHSNIIQFNREEMDPFGFFMWLLCSSPFIAIMRRSTTIFFKRILAAGPPKMAFLTIVAAADFSDDKKPQIITDLASVDGKRKQAQTKKGVKAKKDFFYGNARWIILPPF